MKVTYDRDAGTFTLSIEKAAEQYDERDGKLYISETVTADELDSVLFGAQSNPGDTVTTGDA